MTNHICRQQSGCEVHSLSFVILSLTISIQCLKEATNHLSIGTHVSLVQLIHDKLPFTFPPGQVILWQNPHFSLPFHKLLCHIGWLFPTTFCVVWHSVVSHVPCNYHHFTVRHIPPSQPPQQIMWTGFSHPEDGSSTFFWNTGTFKPLHGSETQRQQLTRIVFHAQHIHSTPSLVLPIIPIFLWSDFVCCIHCSFIPL